MSTLAVALKTEIRRLARKEVRASTQSAVKAVAQHRREIAKLKRQLREQAQKLARLESREGQQSVQSVNGEAQNSARFSARSVKAQRARTGLSAADYARLVGVSSLTIYNWEHGKSRPRNGQLASLVAIRGIGKREAAARLEQLRAVQKRGKATRSRRLAKR
jgi:DNA-binding transcriptional regulator YiaG